MRKCSFAGLSAHSLLAAAIAVAGAASFAENPVGPMSGTGGVMRDAERRALAATPSKDAKANAAPVSDAAPAEQELDKRLKAVEKKVLGPISDVKVFGSVEFAEKTGIAEKLLAELSGDGDRTIGDVTAAIAKVRKELMNEGYYLLRISLARKNTYDPETNALSVLVDQGSFGRLSVKFDGENEEGTWFTSQQIQRRFRYIKEGEPFDYARLRSALFDANTHPDLTIDTAIDVRKPIEGEGNDRRIARYADVNLDVHESIPLHMVWEVNNYGMEEIEEWQTSITAQYLNLTKHDDVLTLSPGMSFGAEMLTFAGSYMLPHTWWLGGNTTLYGGYSDLDVDDIYPQLDLEGAGWFLGLQHSEYLYDTDRHQLAVSVGLMWRYIEDRYKVMGYKLNERGVSILPVTLALSYTGKRADALGGRNFATVQGVFNVMSAGDEVDELWTDSEENYWILRWQLARLQPLFGWYDDKTEKELHQWMLFLKLEGQYTSDTLIPVEKLSLGGYNCLRGYHSRGYLGDYGVYGTAEIRTPILVDAFASCFGDRTDRTPIDRIQFLGFCDYGYVAYNDLPSGFDDDEFLASLGVGARLAVTKYSQLRCDLAFPVADGYNDDDDDCEVYLGVQVQF